MMIEHKPAASPKRRSRARGRADEIEKVGVRRIKLYTPQQNAQVLLGSFFATDRVLMEWSQRSNGKIECKFEITYTDGHQISGNYLFVRKGTGKPGLAKFVRSAALAICRGECGEMVHGISSMAYAFVERYETDDANSY